MAMLTLNEIKKQYNIGDNIKFISSNPKFYYFGLYNGIIMEIIDKTDGITVKYQPMRYKKDENGMRIPSGELMIDNEGKAIYNCRKLIENVHDEYWFETIA